MFSSALSEFATECVSPQTDASLSAWPTLLVVDTDDEITRTLVCFFEKRGFHVAAGTSFADVRRFFHRRKNWTLIISDYHLPDATGAELCDWVQEQGCNAPVLLMSGSPHGAGLCAGYAYLPKPLDLEKLEAYVRKGQKHLPAAMRPWH
jgi:DNA-binding response OmpR family regulator